MVVAPELPHVGVLPNGYFAKLVAETDQLIWVGTRVDPLPLPLRVEGARFLTFHADIVREAADLLLGASGTLRPEAPPELPADELAEGALNGASDADAVLEGAAVETEGSLEAAAGVSEAR